MWAVPTTDYTNYLSPTILLVGDEFIGPVEKDPVRPGFWIPPVNANAGQLLNLWRGNLGTLPQAHTTVDRVMPTFHTAWCVTWRPCCSAASRIALTPPLTQITGCRRERVSTTIFGTWEESNGTSRVNSHGSDTGGVRDE